MQKDKTPQLPANEFQLPPMLYYMLAKDNYDRLVLPDKRVYSPTGLVRPPQVAVLTARHYEKVEQDASDNFFSMLGNMAHQVVADHSPAAALSETRMWYEHDKDRVVAFKPDLLVPVEMADWTNEWFSRMSWEWDEASQMWRVACKALDEDQPHEYSGMYDVEDWKCTSVWSYMLGLKTEWLHQLNIYGYGIRKVLSAQTDIPFKGIRHLKIRMLLRDWNRNEARRNAEKCAKDGKAPEYPQTAFATLKVPILPAADVEAFITERMNLHDSAEFETDDNLPQCTDEEMWSSGGAWAAIYKSSKRAVPNGVFKDDDWGSEAKDMAVKKAFGNNKLMVERRPAIRTRCQSWCAVAPLCHQNKALNVSDQWAEQEAMGS